MQNPIRLFREGSDPEAVAVAGEQVVSAHLFTSQDRGLRLRGEIGTDAHPATLEIRPAPTHNVHYHLLKIADALRAISEFIDGYSTRTKTPIRIVAQPSYLQETMGGHIHLSVWYKNPLAHLLVNELRFVSYQGNLWRLDRTIRLPNEHAAKAQTYLEEAIRGDNLSVDEILHKVHWLVGPFEDMMFGRHRRARNGVADYMVRIPVPQEVPPFERPEWAYLRIEYRYPSTWLYHPELAYCYLGLAKLALVAWPSLPPLQELFEAYHRTQDNKEYKPHQVFQERFTLALQDTKLSSDLRQLPEVVKRWKKQGVGPFPLYVNFPAWEAVLTGEGISK